MESLLKNFPQVKIISRPENLRADGIAMNEILKHDTAQVEADLYLQTHSTNPLLRTETVSRAILTFLDNSATCDSLFSVTRLQTRLYDQSGHALNHDPAVLIQTQDLPPVYEENSCLYLFTRGNLLKRNHRVGAHPFMFEMKADEAWDIDDELDFAVCEFLMSRKGSLPESSK
jgi:CMP-N-acetylneuraminic acid synthetase